MFFKQFGGKVTSTLKEQYANSPNWRDGIFQNQEKTGVDVNLATLPTIMYKQFTNRADRTPSKPLAVQAFDYQTFSKDDGKASFIWYGHSAIFMRIHEKNILVDPMLGPDTSPIAPMATKRFSENTLSLIDNFPDIDLILITHDHYDHLDLASILKLKDKTKKFYVALGVKRHLVSWGIPAENVIEFDWWDQQNIYDIQITFTPTRHFAGRGLTDRAKSFWGGWALRTSNENIWVSGDGGYGPHFREIGERLGPFDFAFMECGQYSDYWRQIHLFPEESVQAAIDAQVQKAMPIHWAGFSLSFQHTWYEPADIFVKTANEKDLTYLLPQIGQVFSKENDWTKNWWKHDI